MTNWDDIPKKVEGVYSTLNSLLKIVLLLIFVYFLIIAGSWINHEEKGIIINPFDATTLSEEDLGTNNIADLLRSELIEIHDELAYAPTKWDRSISMDKLGLQYAYLQPLTDYPLKPLQVDLFLKPNEDDAISQMGSVEVLGSSFPLGPLLVSSKYLAGQERKVISGFIKKQGTEVVIEAIYDDPKNGVFVSMVNGTLNANQSIEDLIPLLIEDLAYKVAHGINSKFSPDKEGYPSNWLAFKYLLEGKNALRCYFDTNDLRYLADSKDKTLRAVELEPTYKGDLVYSLLYGIASSYLTRDNTYDAEIIFRNLTRIRPDLGYFGLGLVYSKERLYSRARIYYEMAANIDPKSAETWENIGNDFYRQGNDNDSITAYNKSINIYKYLKRLNTAGININTQYANVYTDMGRSLHNLSRFNEAIDAYDNALSLDPNFFAAWNGKGITLDKQGRHGDAVNAFDKATQLDPSDASAWNNKGNAIFSLGDYEESLHIFDTSIELTPNNEIAWNGRGNALYALGRYEDALQGYDESIKINKIYKYPWNGRGNTLYSLGRYEDALQAYDNATNIDPKYLVAWNSKGNTLYALERYEDALRAFDNATSIDPSYMVAWNGKGNVLYAMKRYKEALEAFNRAIAIDPDKAEAWYNKGVVLEALGRTAEADNAFARAEEPKAQPEKSGF
jgi:tetratricopeptide (TPR) repeat protein